MSIVLKVALAYYVVVLLPVATFVLVGSARAERRERDETIARYERTLLQTTGRINEALLVAEQITDLLVLNYEVVDLLSKDFVLQDIIPFRERVIRLIRNIVGLTPNSISGMTVYVDNDSVPESWYTVMSMDKFRHRHVIDRLLDRRQNGVWLHSDFGNRGIEDLSFLYIRPLFRFDGSLLGVVECELPANRIVSQALALVNPEDPVLLIDADGDAIVSSRAASVDRDSLSELATADVKAGIYETESRIYVYDLVDPLRVRLAVGLSRERLLERMRNRNVATVIVFLSSIVFVGFLSLFISRRILGRFRMIVSVMNRVAHGHLDERIPSSGEDEIAEITQDFNLLIGRIRTLIHETAEKERRQNEARFMALQYRINPHMIYNTLEIFGTRMELAGDYEAAEAMSDFGKLLRYHTAGNYRSAAVEQEVSQVENYVSVERIRHGDRVSLTVELPEDVRNRRMMRFVLQPLVENSLRHGMRAGTVLHIAVRARIEGEVLAIVVEDDGVGMSRDTLAAVRSALRRPAEEDTELFRRRGIGLRNIHERSILIHGAQYGLAIESHPSRGTRVTYRAPSSEESGA